MAGADRFPLFVWHQPQDHERMHKAVTLHFTGRRFDEINHAAATMEVTVHLYDAYMKTYSINPEAMNPNRWKALEGSLGV
jgi:hypothetical protein